MIIIGQLVAIQHVCETRGRDSKHMRVKKWCQYMHQGWPVCITRFYIQ